ncbi:MAG: class D sortase [Saccharofermentanales bacterium]
MKQKIKKKTVLLIAALALLTTAAVLITYSLVMIIGAKMREKERMGEWDAMLDQQSSSSVSDPSSTAGAESDDPSSSAASLSDPALTPVLTPAPTPKPQSGSSYKPVLLGVLTFFTIGNKEVVVVEGVTRSDLRGAAGHAPYSAKPGKTGNSIIFGHRDGVFIGFKNLKIGDTFKLKTLYDEFTYRIVSMTIVPPEDPLITKRYFEPMMTLVTCYPFRYVGNAPDRYVVVSELVP